MRVRRDNSMSAHDRLRGWESWRQKLSGVFSGEMFDRQTLIWDICADYQKATRHSFYSEQDFSGLEQQRPVFVLLLSL